VSGSLVRARLLRLEQRYHIDAAIDERSYRELKKKLRQDLDDEEAVVLETGLPALDLDAALAASEHVLTHAAELWRRGTLSQRQKLQAALFPKGLAHGGKTFGTVTTCIAFKLLEEKKVGVGKMASLPPPSWNRILAWLREMAALRDSGILAA